MKTKKLFFALLLIISVTGLQAQSKMYEKFSNSTDIQTVFISKSMLGSNMELDEFNTKDLTGKLDQIEVYTTKNQNGCNLLKAEAKALLQTKTYEVLMSVKEEKNNVTFYGTKEKDLFKDLLVVVEQPSECVVVRLMGSFTMEDIGKITDKVKKK